MSNLLYRLGRFCARHGRWVTVAWVVVAVAVIVVGHRLGGGSTDAVAVGGSDSAVAQTLLDREFPGRSADASPIVLKARSGGVTDPAYADALRDTVQRIRRIPGVGQVSDPPAAGDAALSPDGHIGYLTVTPESDSASTLDLAERVRDATGPATGAGLDVAVGGQLGQQLSKSPVHTSELIGIVVAVVVMLLAFGSAVAMGVPIVTAVLSVGGGLALLQLLGNAAGIPTVAATLATMIGLGVGIDYGLFLVVRFRRLLAGGLTAEEAAGRTAGTSGGAIVFAAGTVVIAVCGLALSGVAFVGWLGYSAAIVVAVSLGSAVTLTPALLGWLGPGVNRLSLPGRRRGAAVTGPEDLAGTAWARLAVRVAGRPLTTTLAATAVLLTLAAPVLALRLGQMDAGRLPAATESRRSYDTLAEGFGPGANGPLRVVVEMFAPATAPDGASTTDGQDPRARDDRLVALRAALAQSPGVRTVSDPVISADSAVAVFGVTEQTSPSDERTVELVHRLRDTTLPRALAGRGAEGHVGGLTATKADLAGRISQRLPVLIGAVLAFAGLLVLLAFRSLWLAAKAAAMNLLSIAAAYGVVVAVFQWGWGVGLLGLDGPVPIESYVPMMMFAILFGLSMDYEVFLLSSIQEHWHATRDNARAVSLGLADTGRIVSSAALIMVAVFASFLINANPVVKMFGLGLSVAVAVDATVVRCLLVPGVMVLIGERQWRLPPLLDRLLPGIAIEADPAFFDSPPVAPARNGHDVAIGGGRWSTAAVAVPLIVLIIVVTVHRGSVAAATPAVVALLLGAFVAGRRQRAGVGARGAGLLIGAATSTLAFAGAAVGLPQLPSAAGLTIALTVLLAAVPPLLSRGRIPPAATLAATVAGTVGWAAGEPEATVLLCTAAGFTVSLLGRLLGTGLRRRQLSPDPSTIGADR
ncbi:Membrane protein ydfJ [Actinoplanes sp. SE50]|uniref:MMPL family transporter n=1 Tax=unclassified Actinoplanes TaxID=2626549 RepID=UPI00023EC473|nr:MULTISPECIES: MMPL family transporter [unclassified Actinoplanes]AEV84638.1 Membrane protein ydfJ [Actinoplanes sp. SE50/110]ATO83030.1 Membrane protein ydfJ [Actinoplanes sp. SE50]SLM00438.1 Membrane protein ydfJ [Actinoplanes sp. SE50/110]